MKRAAWIGPLLVVLTAWRAGAQQPSVQLTAAAQVTTGDELRLGGQRRFEPDLGIQVFDPGFRFGQLYADVSVTRRGSRAAIGRGVLRLEGWRAAGLTWSLDAGDTWSAPAVQDFGFSNLFAPQVTLRGVSIRGTSARTSVVATAGQVTAQRNIFGTDSQTIGQRLYQVSASHRASPRLDISARGVYVRSGPMQWYTAFTDRSTDVGGGIRYRPAASIQIVADAGFTAFRRRGVGVTEYAPSALAGALMAFSHGWVQINAQRYSLGHYPVSNFPYGDRSGVFLAGEVDLSASARLFGGGEYARSNLNPAASAAATVGVPPGEFSRLYGGARIALSSSSTLTVRIEGGGRQISRSRFSSGFDTNTGVVTSEWHGRFGAASLFARYERRSNVDANDSGSSFTQHDASSQVFVNLRGGRQVFALAFVSTRADRSGNGETVWHAGAGGQMSLGPFSLRLEATLGRTHDWPLSASSSRRSLAAGVSGRIGARTSLSIDCYIDHSPPAAGISGRAWTTRTMIRATRSLSFGRARAPRSAGLAPRGGGSGSVTGTVFADWNGNGVMDDDEPPVSGITLSLGGSGQVQTGTDGRFAFAGVPVGTQSVSLDLASVPADYDPPAEQSQSVAVARSRPVAVQFALLPLGAVRGTVYQDVDGDGKMSEGDVPVDRAVLVLDEGARTELTRDGRFRFESVRMGSHTVGLLIGSLPDGAQLTGPATVTVALGRGGEPDALVFLVKLEKRPEVRKVFPPKKVE